MYWRSRRGGGARRPRRPRPAGARRPAARPPGRPRRPAPAPRGPPRGRLPLRLRTSPARLIALLALIAVAVAIVLVLGVHNTHRGTGPAAALKAPPKLANVDLNKNAAHDYDPYGTGGEHPEATRFAVDRDPSSTWTTENYDAGDLQKPGVGLYIDAKPSVDAKALRIQTPTHGFDVEVYAAKSTLPKTVPDPGWKL